MDPSRMVKESLWACELSNSKQSYQWNVSDDITDEDVEINRSLLIKHAVLGADAKAGEVSVVQLETVDAEGDPIKQPIMLLRAGKIDMCAIDIVVHQPGAKFSLAKGSGPVHIWGQLIEDFGGMNDMQSDEDEDDDEELAEEMNDLTKESLAAAMADSKKRKIAGPPEKGNPKKIAKVEAGDGKDSESDEPEEEEDSDNEDTPPKKGNKGKATPKVVPAGNAKAVRGRKK